MRGIVDFNKARLHDADWWRYLHVMFRGMERDDNATTLGKIYQFHLALAGNSGLTEESFEKAQKNAKDTFNDLLAVYRPWEGLSDGDRKKKEAVGWRQAYIDSFGADPSDPEFQKELDKQLAAWTSEVQTKLNAEPSAFELVRKRLEERDARVSELVRARRKQGR